MNRLVNHLGSWRTASLIVLLGGAVLTLSVPVLAVDETPAEVSQDSPAVADPVADLVAQLGHDSFFVRERAQQDLAAMGFDAFDALTAAEHHEDIEIAARARYLLRLLEVQWVSEDDPPEVQALLSEFDQLDVPARREQMRQLAALPDGMGLEALCRLARFQRNELLSKWAALLVVEQDSGHEQWEQFPTGQPADETAVWALSLVEPPPQSSLEVISEEAWALRREVILKAIAASPRPGAEWLRSYANLRTSEDVPTKKWSELVEAEAQVLARTPQQSDAMIVSRMLLQQATWLRTLNRPAEADAAMFRILDFVGSDADSLAEMVMWLVRSKTWAALDELENRFAAVIQDNPLLAYTIAYARSQQGQTERAEALAESARKLNPEDYKAHYDVAAALQDRGWTAWAEGEYQAILDHEPRNEEYANYVIVSQRWLAELLNDQGDELAASVMMDQTNEMLEELAKKTGQQQNRLFNPRPTEARRDLFFGLHLIKEGKFDEAREHLYDALQYDDTDADVLIALYELPNLDEKQRKELGDDIREACELFRGQIEQDPENATPYNQLAWLVANTEGDQDEALRASLRSLELGDEPTHPGRLDTLARCYYAQGNLEKAVEVQTKAVQLEPQTGQMSRQLAFFLKQRDAAKDESAE